MTLIGAILKKVNSQNALQRGKYTSPPPELEECPKKKQIKPTYKYQHVQAVVDSAPPSYDPARLWRHLPEWKRRAVNIYCNNMILLTAIKQAHFNRGKVDSRWKTRPRGSLQYFRRRADFCKRVEALNREVYERIINTESRLPTAAELGHEWVKNRRQIIHRAQAKFVLFPPVPQEIMEDAAFAAPPGVKRPRVYLTLRVRNCAVMGDLRAELFTDVCPDTCRLFLELLDADGLGYGYVGTCFFRKVPGLFWSGGDVVYDNGFGCYAQRGRRVPIGAENYHFPHSMPGLLSMRVTQDDEMCGIFNITFKPLPQFDLKSVVFGRIIRPCNTFDSIVSLGSPLSAHPTVLLCGARRRERRHWLRGQPNTRLAEKTRSFRD